MTVSLVVIASLICIIILYLFIQNNILQISYQPVSDQKIGQSFSGYKIAHISDFHSTYSIVLKKMIISALQKEKVDLIVITGDLVDARHFGWSSAFQFIEKIQHFAPIVFVSGNHEVSMELYNEFIQKLKSLGVQVLCNDKIQIKKESGHINLFGMEDPAIKAPKPIAFTAKTFLQSMSVSCDEYNVLLTHRPELISLYSKREFDLVFAGHAHGGQFRTLKHKGVFSSGEGLWPKFTEGKHHFNSTILIISRGIGKSSFPFRINNRPELIFVTLNSDCKKE